MHACICSFNKHPLNTVISRHWRYRSEWNRCNLCAHPASQAGPCWKACPTVVLRVCTPPNWLNQGQTADPEEARPLAGQNPSVSLSGSYELKDTEIEQIKHRKDRDSYLFSTYWSPWSPPLLSLGIHQKITHVHPGYGVRQTWVWILAPLFINYDIIDKFFDFSPYGGYF